MKKPILIAIGILVLLLAGLFVIRRGTPTQGPVMGRGPATGRGPAGSSESQPTNLRKAPNFVLADYAGKTVRLMDFHSKPVVLNSWAAWCPFCRKELPDFAAVQKEFSDRVTIIAIDRAESLETAKRYSDELGVTNDLVFLLDPSDSFYKSIGGFTMPETIFVDKNGLIREHKRGPMDVEEMREKIQKIL